MCSDVKEKKKLYLVPHSKLLIPISGKMPVSTPIPILQISLGQFELFEGDHIASGKWNENNRNNGIGHMIVVYVSANLYCQWKYTLFSDSIQS